MEHQKRIIGVKIGVGLDPVGVQQGRHWELDNIELLGVRTVITLSEARQCGFKLVYAKWQDDVKIVDGDPTAVRSSLLAAEIKSYAREDASQSTLPIKCSRLILSLALSRTALPGTMCEWLRFTLPLRARSQWSRREASKCCGNTVIDTLAAANYPSVQVDPMTFHHDTHGHGFSTTCHKNFRTE